MSKSWTDSVIASDMFTKTDVFHFGAQVFYVSPKKLMIFLFKGHFHKLGHVVIACQSYWSEHVKVSFDVNKV